MEEIVMFGRRCGKTTMAKKCQELVDTLKADGWEQDRFGHMQKQISGKRRDTGATVTRQYRVKLQATSCRIEIKSDQKNFDGGYDWIRVGGDYYTNIVKLDDGRIRVGSYFFGGKNAPIPGKP